VQPTQPYVGTPTFRGKVRFCTRTLSLLSKKKRRSIFKPHIFYTTNDSTCRPKRHDFGYPSTQCTPQVIERKVRILQL